MSRTAGIGLVLVERESKIIVDSLRPGGPASLDGTIRTGDLILAVNGCVVRGLNVCVTLIVGDAGTPVRLSCKRGRLEYEVTIYREMPPVKTVQEGKGGQIQAQLQPSKNEILKRGSENSNTVDMKNLSPLVPTANLDKSQPIESKTLDNTSERVAPSGGQSLKVQSPTYILHPYFQQLLQDLKPLSSDLSSIRVDLSMSFSIHLQALQKDSNTVLSKLLHLKSRNRSLRPALLLVLSDLDACASAVTDLRRTIDTQPAAEGDGHRLARRYLHRLRAAEEQLRRQARPMHTTARGESLKYLRALDSFSRLPFFSLQTGCVS